MNNQMMINSHVAVIGFDPDVGLFRGEFVGLNGGADFYADSVDSLHTEGELSLNAFLAVCQAEGIQPYKQFSGKFMTRVPASLHERVVAAAAAAGMSLNQWVQTALEREVASR